MLQQNQNNLISAWNRLESAIKDVDETYEGPNLNKTSSQTNFYQDKNNKLQNVQSLRSLNQKTGKQTDFQFSNSNRQQLQRPTSMYGLNKRPMSSSTGQLIRPLTGTTNGRPMTGKTNNNRPFTGSISQINNKQMFQPHLSQTSSIKSLLNLKAKSRPHSKLGRENPIVAQKDLQVFQNMTMTEFDKLKKQTEKINSLYVDEILDLYNSRCQDMSIEYTPHQAVRFIEKFKEACKNSNMTLSEQSFGTQSAKILALILENNDYFTHLNLSKNLLSNIGAIILSEALRENEKVIHVDLSSNNIGPEGASAIFQSIQANSYIVSIDLSSSSGLNRNFIGSMGVEPLEYIFKINKTLQYLNIGGSSVNLHGVKCIMEGLKNNTSLIVLNLSNSLLGPALGHLLKKSLQFTSILDLDIRKNNIGDEGLIEFGSLLSETDIQLKILNLSDNKIQSHGVAAFFEQIYHCKSLKRLILNSNNFSQKGFQIISSFLSINNSLQMLSMKYCGITQEGGIAIGAGLGNNSGLKILILAQNFIKNVGALEIAKGLLLNKTIKFIDFSTCRIADEGGAQLAKAWKNHPKLLEIVFWENSLKNQSGQVLLDVLIHNYKITKLNIKRNLIDYKYQEDIQKRIQINKQHNKIQRVPTIQNKRDNLIEFGKQKQSLAVEKLLLDQQQKISEQDLDGQKQIFDKEKQQEIQLNESMENELKQLYQETQEEIKKLNQFDTHSIGVKRSLNDELSDLDFEKRQCIHDSKELETIIKVKQEKFQIDFNKFHYEVIKLKKELEKCEDDKNRTLKGLNGFQKQVNLVKERIQKEEQAKILKENKKEDNTPAKKVAKKESKNTKKAGKK